MLLFIKSFIIGIGKIIPGVSGAVLAINFQIYEKLLNAVTDFFNDWKANLKFLLIVFTGIIFGIISFSNTLLFLLNNYKFITLMFFIGLILGGTYKLKDKIAINYKTIFIIIIICLLFTIISLISFDNKYYICGNFVDNIMFFIGGFIEIFASIVPGISSTSLLMIIGIYNDILSLISRIYDFSYVILNINLYLSYSLGIIFSFFINTYLISYLLKKFSYLTYVFIYGLSLSSSIYLIILTFSLSFSFIELIIGIMLLTIGLVIAIILNR